MQNLSNPKKSYVRDILIITALFVPASFVILSTAPMSDILIDGPWYLNRAHLYQKGIFTGAFVYTLLFPILIGLFDAIVHNLLIAGFLVNALALYSITLGTYLLGRSLYHRKIAWFAVLIILTSPSLSFVARLLWADILFVAVILWCILVCLFLIRHPSTLRAALLGVGLSAALFARLEGAVYGLLIPIAVWNIYRSSRNARRAIGLGLISVIPFMISLGIYGIVLMRNAGSGGDAFALIRIFSETPVPWDIVGRRFTDTLTTFLSHWPVWAWWLVLIALMWSSKRNEVTNRTLGALIIFNIVYAFLLSIWPYPRHTGHYLPLFAVLFSAAVSQLTNRSRYRKVLAPLLVTAVCLPGLSTMTANFNVKPFAYLESQLAQDGAAVDNWLAQRGWSDTEIHTLCSDLIPFTRSNFVLVYRLAFSADTNTFWDTPSRLLPSILKQNGLFMTCGEQVFYPDWKDFFENWNRSDDVISIRGSKPVYTAQLSEVGRVSNYAFYRVTHVQ